MAAPVSAFAKRKTARNQSTEIVQSIKEVDVAEQCNHGDLEVTTPARKKRKRGNELRYTLPVPPPPSETFDIQNHVCETSAVDHQNSSDSDVEESIEAELPISDSFTSSNFQSRQLSTFSLKRSTLLNATDSEWTIRLHSSDNLAILGQCDLWVRSGAIGVLGAVIHASSKLHRIYAPSSHSISPIRPVPNPYGTGNPPCEISLLSCGNRIRLLSQVSPKFRRLWNAQRDSSERRRSFVNLQNSADDPYLRPLRLVEASPDWKDMVSKLVSHDLGALAVTVCGPKGSGKSTFCRILLNALLTKCQASESLSENDYVAFLDLDPGQPEYSPPGDISLHKLRSYNFGPPFTNPITHGNDETIKVHHFGYLSPKDDPDHYYKCALDLFDNYKALTTGKHSCPLIVNCSGWVQGSGLNLLAKFVHDFDLSDVIYMSTEGPQEVTNELSDAAEKSDTSLHQLTSQTPQLSTRTSADLRVMQALSYFHLDEPEGNDLRWKALPLTNIPPTTVHYAGLQQGIAAVMVLGDEQDPAYLETMLEGCVVCVVAVDEDLLTDEAISQDYDIDNDNEFGTAHIHPNTLLIRRNPNNIPYIPPQNHTTPPLPPSRSHSLGQALIRSIDPHSSSFHLTTPISPSTITHAQNHHQKIVLVRGKLDKPTWAYAEGFEYEKARRKRRERVLGEKEEWGGEDVRRWAEGQPWAGVVDGGRTRSAKVRRARRDLKYKSQVEEAGK